MDDCLLELAGSSSFCSMCWVFGAVVVLIFAGIEGLRAPVGPSFGRCFGAERAERPRDQATAAAQKKHDQVLSSLATNGYRKIQGDWVTGQKLEHSIGNGALHEFR